LKSKDQNTDKDVLKKRERCIEKSLRKPILKSKDQNTTRYMGKRERCIEKRERCAG
jgi:hypothetical protein